MKLRSRFMVVLAFVGLTSACGSNAEEASTGIDALNDPLPRVRTDDFQDAPTGPSAAPCNADQTGASTISFSASDSPLRVPIDHDAAHGASFILVASTSGTPSFTCGAGHDGIDARISFSMEEPAVTCIERSG